MPSIMTKMIMKTMKKQPRFTLPADGDYETLRRQVEETNERLPIEKGVTFVRDQLAGVDVELTNPEKLRGEDIIFYIHGGGLIHGSCTSTHSYASYLSVSTGLRVYTISYRLAPEHKAPVGVTDCYEVYKALQDKYPNSKIALLGESGGGTMVLAATLMAKDKGILLPACVVAFAPCTNMADDLPSRTQNDLTDISVSGQGIREMIKLYVGEGDPRNPYISPAFGDYTGFPPLFVIVDDGEVLFDDSEQVVNAAKKAGVEVEYQVTHGLFHTYEVLGKMIPEGKQAMEDTVAFLYKHLGMN